MTTTGQKGAFGFAPQTAKSVAGSTFYWYRATGVDFGPVTDERPFPPEVGGVLTPTGAYRAGAYAAGGIDFAPRLEDEFGWILDWVLGENDVTTQDTPVAGANKHVWTLDGSEDALPWGTVHVITPGATDLGTIALDCKAAGLRLTLPQSGLAMARLDLVGRLFNTPADNIFVSSPAGAGWTPAFESYTSVPVSAKGAFTVAGLMGGAELAVTGIGLEFANGMTSPAQEMVFGSYAPDDYATVARTVTVRSTYKWPDAQLYRSILTGSASGTDWTDQVFEGQAVVQVQAPANITGTTPYELKYTLPNVIWQVTNPRLAGANIVAIDLIGTAISQPGENYLVSELFNGVATAYTWPG